MCLVVNFKGTGFLVVNFLSTDFHTKTPRYVKILIKGYQLMEAALKCMIIHINFLNNHIFKEEDSALTLERSAE